ncbi:hypothetical protein BB560_000730 [Smittium megazygosporum]|uniref:Ran-GTPase activating protein 1 C-terminal domain-containing protein n=1 Tax=Smittium megazygosporum TaxID=133381 RepID=A0A2T9ZJG2_9FUNG|nr:hypothetical protein BB560_000730 [Smittium megazygosporum]
MSVTGDKLFSLEGKGLKLTTAEDMKQYAQQIADFDQLEEIVLSGNTIGVEAAKELAKDEVKESVKVLCDSMVDLPKLESLNLSDNAFGPIGAESMYDFLVSNKSLKTLYLNNNGLGIQGGSLIADAFIERHESDSSEDKSRLEVLVMGRNRLENGSSEKLSKMFTALGSLKVVRLPQNGIRPEGVSAIMKGLSENHNLVHLDLQDNTFMNAGSEALAQALSKWKNLEILNVGDCLLSATGAIHVVKALKHNTKLKEINLQYNEIEEDSILELILILELLKDLAFLELNGNRFSAESDPKSDSASSLPEPSEVQLTQKLENLDLSNQYTLKTTSITIDGSENVEMEIDVDTKSKLLTDFPTQEYSKNTDTEKQHVAEQTAGELQPAGSQSQDSSELKSTRKKSATEQLNQDISDLIDSMKNDLKL